MIIPNIWKKMFETTNQKIHENPRITWIMICSVPQWIGKLHDSCGYKKKKQVRMTYFVCENHRTKREDQPNYCLRLVFVGLKAMISIVYIFPSYDQKSVITIITL